MTERDQYTKGLRELADWLDAHDEIPLPDSGKEWSPIQWVAADADVISLLGRRLPGKRIKDGNDTFFYLDAAFSGVAVQAFAHRQDVCERVVVGTEEVKLPAEPAREALPERVEEREIVKWICSPLLDESVWA